MSRDSASQKDSLNKSSKPFKCWFFFSIHTYHKKARANASRWSYFLLCLIGFNAKWAGHCFIFLYRFFPNNNFIYFIRCVHIIQFFRMILKKSYICITLDLHISDKDFILQPNSTSRGPQRSFEEICYLYAISLAAVV